MDMAAWKGWSGPDQINAKHGKPTWRCNSCHATTNLTWWRYLSVAVCRDNPACSAAEASKFKSAIEAEEAQAAYDREWFGTNQEEPSDEN